MCGIAGLLQTNPYASLRSDVSKMPLMLLHRGPDHIGSWSKENIFLFQTRLKILDLSSNANGPIFNEDKSIVLTFNGEIYNYKELRQFLLKKNHTFLSEGDGEVIVHLYEEVKEDFPKYLDGMFALALWDQKKKLLCLSRDRTGKKPLFYYQTSDFFAFASEIKAFSPIQELPLEKNTDFFPYYFLYGYIPTPFTFYKNVFSLEPGHSLFLEREKSFKKIKYWDVRSYFNTKKINVSESDMAVQVKEILDRAVLKRLISDVPLGIFLSGGIDSSIITSIVSEKSSSPIKTFSIGFQKDPHSDETYYAKILANHFKTDHHEIHIDSQEVPPLLDKLVWHYDGPYGDPSCIPTALVSRFAKQKVTVVLTGDGGDEVFGGYNRFLASLWMEHIPSLFWKLSQKCVDHRLTRASHLSLIDRPSYWTAFFHSDLLKILNANFYTSSSVAHDFHYHPYLKDCASLSNLSKLLYLNLKTYLLDDLNPKTDRSTMMVALEARSPFLDHHLIEYCATLPDHFLIRGLQKKYILKKAYKDKLPSEIYKRGKMGFEAPLGKWFRNSLRPFLLDEFSDLKCISDYVNTSYIKELLKKHLEGEDHTYKLWNILMFKKWIA